MSTKKARIADEVIAACGGQANLTRIENCITRLRLHAVDEEAIDIPALRAIEGVIGVVEDETVQVVLGPGLVNEVAEEMKDRLGETSVVDGPVDGPEDPDAAGVAARRGQEMRQGRKARNQTPFKAFLRRIANIFLPLIPALIACGIIAGFNGLLINLTAGDENSWATSVTPALGAIASGFMSLIAVFVGMNAAKEFGGTPVLGGAVAAIIPFAGVADVSILGAELSPGQGGVIGALFAAVLAAYVERWVRTWAPASLSMLIVPTVTVGLVGGLTLFPLMSVAGWIASGIGVAANWLLGVGGALAGFVLAGLFLPLVMLGLHQALIPIHTTLIEQSGYTVLLPVLAMAGAGQVGAAAAVYLRCREESMKRTIKSALPAGLLGVGEPLIYGVTLPLGRPFITACLGGAFGGGFVGLFNQLGTEVGSTAIGPSGWALFPLTQGNHGPLTSAAIYGGGLVVAYIAGFIITYFFGRSAEAAAALVGDAGREGGKGANLEA